VETKATDDKPSTQDVWMRGLFMLLFIIAFGAGVWLLNLLAIVQFLWLLFAREPNQFIVRFGNSLSTWFAEIGAFLTCATNHKPFPWRPWPDANASPPSITTSSS
jgi:Domain of unknown function (DUF4389)